MEQDHHLRRSFATYRTGSPLTEQFTEQFHHLRHSLATSLDTLTPLTEQDSHLRNSFETYGTL